MYINICIEGCGRISDLTDAFRDVRFIENEHPRSGENGRVATSVPLITDNSRKRGAREIEKKRVNESNDDGIVRKVRV